jgi:hypothetical protein
MHDFCKALCTYGLIAIQGLKNFIAIHYFILSAGIKSTLYNM